MFERPNTLSVLVPLPKLAEYLDKSLFYLEVLQDYDSTDSCIEIFPKNGSPAESESQWSIGENCPRPGLDIYKLSKGSRHHKRWVKRPESRPTCVEHNGAAIGLVLSKLLSGSFDFLAYRWQRIVCAHGRTLSIAELFHLKAE